MGQNAQGMPGGNAQNGEKPADLPEMNDQFQNGDKENNLPETNGQTRTGKNAGANTQTRAGKKNSGSAMNENSKAEEQPADMIDFDAMLNNGVISQETHDKIVAYMEEHKPADLPEANGQKPADLPEMSGEKPADLPEMNGEKPADLPEMNSENQPEGEGTEAGGLLTDLLKDGIITQAEYDALLAAK